MTWAIILYVLAGNERRVVVGEVLSAVLHLRQFGELLGQRLRCRFGRHNGRGCIWCGAGITRPPDSSPGFTLIEVMIVCAIVGILAATFFPLWQRWRAGDPIFGPAPVAREQFECERRGGFWEVSYGRGREAVAYRCAAQRGAGEVEAGR